MSRNDEHRGTSNRGFASMDQAKQRAIASKGGQSVRPEKRSFSQDPQLAAQAGRKGGESVPPEGRSFSQNRELAAEAGRKGGQARGASAHRRAMAARVGAAEAQRHAEVYEENPEIATEGLRKTAMPRGDMEQEPGMNRQMSSPDQGNEGDEENLGHEDMETGNADVEGGDLGQTPGMPRPGSGREHPHGAQ